MKEGREAKEERRRNERRKRHEGSTEGRKEGRKERRIERSKDGRKGRKEETPCNSRFSPRMASLLLFNHSTSSFRAYQEERTGREGRKYNVQTRVNVNIPVQNIQSTRMFKSKIFSQQGCSSPKYSVTRNVPVQYIPSAGMFQSKLLSQ